MTLKNAKFLLFFLPLTLGCATSDDFCIFGYTTKSQFQRDIKTIRVPIFENRTFYRDIEFDVTEAVIKEIERRTPWKVVQCGPADAELTGAVLNLGKHVIFQNQLNEVREADTMIAVELVWRDLRNGELLSQRPPHRVDPDAPPKPIIVTDPLQPVKNNPMVPKILVQANESFVPELGESIATARMRVVNKLARQVVNSMEMPW
jgi:hypothetical protein